MAIAIVSAAVTIPPLLAVALSKLKFERVEMMVEAGGVLEGSRAQGVSPYQLVFLD